MPQPNPWDAFPVAPAVPTGGPLPSPPPKPDENLPSGYRVGPSGVAERIPGLPETEKSYRTLTPDEVAAKGLNPRTVYQIDSRGQISAITGGKPAAALRQGDSDKLRGAIDQFASFTSLNDTFTDDYGGNLLGGVENTAQRYSPVDVGTPGQAQWWSSLAAIDNLIRNDLFGASLTAGEKAAYAKTTVTPGMNPDQIRLNLKTRENIMRGALSRYINGLKAGGWNEQEIDALMGDVSRRIFPEQAATAEASDDPVVAARRSTDPLTPPAFGSGGGPPAIPNAGFLTNAGGQIAGNVHDGGDNPAEGIARGESRRVDNPVLAGVRDEYTKRLARGDSADKIIAWARQVGISETADQSIREQVAFRAKHPEIAIGEYDTSQMDDMFVPLTDRERGAAEGADNAVGAATIAAGDAFTGFNMDSLVGLTGGNAERARLGMGEIAERHPAASLIGTVAGGTAAALGAEGALAARGMAAGLPRMLLADGAYGAVAGAGATDYADDGTPATVADRFLGAGKGVLAGVGGSYAGFRTANALGRIGRGVSDASVTALRGEGIDGLTVGQVYGQSGKIGKSVKGIEDRLAGLPVVGDMINARRAEGVRQFNAKAFDKALAPIGGTVGDLVGEEAVERAQTQVSAAFREALGGKGAVPDQAFDDALREAVGKVAKVKRLGEEVVDQIGEILLPYADDGLISGEALDDISRNLRGLRNAYSQDPLAIPLARRIDQVERAIFDLFDRQVSGTIPAYQSARQAYRRLSVIEDAVLKGKNTDGVFTPAQLGFADRTNSVRFDGKRTAARGGGVFHDYQRAAQNVLPNKVPDSGTVGRLLVPLAGAGIIGGDAYTGDGLSTTGLTIGTILAALYTKGGQRLLTKPGRGMKPSKIRALLESPATRRGLGAVSGAGAAAALTDQR